jgi:hypothetical protein
MAAKEAGLWINLESEAVGRDGGRGAAGAKHEALADGAGIESKASAFRSTCTPPLAPVSAFACSPGGTYEAPPTCSSVAKPAANRPAFSGFGW